MYGVAASTAAGAVPIGAFYRPELKAVASPAGVWSGACSYPAVLVENCGHINYGHGMDNDLKVRRGWWPDTYVAVCSKP